MTRRRKQHGEESCSSCEDCRDRRLETAPLSPRMGQMMAVQLITRPSPIVSPQSQRSCSSSIAQEKENDPLLIFPSFEDDQDCENCLSSLEELNMSNLSIHPIRNLINTFDSFDMVPATGSQLHSNSTLEEARNDDSLRSTKHSPSSVADFHDRPAEASKGDCTKERQRTSSSSSSSYLSPKPIAIPHFHLHPTLQLHMKQPVVDRCSFYTVIHDVNKEVLGMLQHDKYSMSTFSTTTTQSVEEEYCLLLMAVEGSKPNTTFQGRSVTASDSTVDSTIPSGRDHPNTCFPASSGHQLDMALATIDEEMFILRAIASRTPEEMNIRACPATFSEAMGDVEPIENRTQLWKPGRSWWEAKSGKNPWIEASSHNKRWRYLWPLIHYHKFLAKCIKKLRRHNIDVRTSLSPVSSFLREEVCAISEHLATISHFTSEQWMEALGHFEGWHDPKPEGQERLRHLVATLDLRKVKDTSDVDSALLRNQIDESFLRAMVLAAKELDGEVSASVGSQSDRMAHSITSPSMGSSGRVALPPSGRIKTTRNRYNTFAHNTTHVPVPVVHSPSKDMVAENMNMRRETMIMPPPPPIYSFPPSPYAYIMYPPPQYFQPSFCPYPADVRMMQYAPYPGYNGLDVHNESLDYTYDFSFHSDVETSFLS